MRAYVLSILLLLAQFLFSVRTQTQNARPINRKCSLKSQYQFKNKLRPRHPPIATPHPHSSTNTNCESAQPINQKSSAESHFQHEGKLRYYSREIQRYLDFSNFRGGDRGGRKTSKNNVLCTNVWVFCLLKRSSGHQTCREELGVDRIDARCCHECFCPRIGTCTSRGRICYRGFRRTSPGNRCSRSATFDARFVITVKETRTVERFRANPAQSGRDKAIGMSKNWSPGGDHVRQEGFSLKHSQFEPNGIGRMSTHSKRNVSTDTTQMTSIAIHLQFSTVLQESESADVTGSSQKSHFPKTFRRGSSHRR